LNRTVEYIVIALIALGAAAVGAAGAAFIGLTRLEIAGAEARNIVLSLNAPPGAVTIEENSAFKGGAAPVPPATPAPGAPGDWPSYNKTLTSERFSDLAQINAKNVDKLKVLCAYDTHRFTALETGLIMVEGALIGDGIRHFLDRPGDLRRELAHA
jgi:alcohol dehydrogenase (cytochrome c)